jgi:nucleotide-binding universal stress UspA family protein
VPSTIVVGYDGSDGARRALGRVAALRDESDRVVVVTAAPSVYPPPYAVLDTEEEPKTKALLAEASSLLDRHGVAAETRMPVGDPAEGLVATARELGAALVVVGRRRDSLARHVLGSVSKKVVEHAPCDVLVVR